MTLLSPVSTEECRFKKRVVKWKDFNLLCQRHFFIYCVWLFEMRFMSLFCGCNYYVSGYNHTVERVLTLSPKLVSVIGDSYCWDIFLPPPDDDIKMQTLTVVVSVSHHLFSTISIRHTPISHFSRPGYFFLSHYFVSVCSCHSTSPPPPYTLCFQRQVLRPGTVFSVHLKSWWRRSSRLPACGRARSTAEECSSPTRTQEVDPAAATAP